MKKEKKTKLISGLVAMAMLLTSSLSVVAETVETVDPTVNQEEVETIAVDTVTEEQAVLFEQIAVEDVTIPLGSMEIFFNGVYIPEELTQDIEVEVSKLERQNGGQWVETSIVATFAETAYKVTYLFQLGDLSKEVSQIVYYRNLRALSDEYIEDIGGTEELPPVGALLPDGTVDPDRIHPENESAIVMFADTAGQWVQMNGRWCFQYPNGSWAYNTWIQTNGLFYYCDGTGYMVTGWIQLGGKWYYLDPNNGGAMVYRWQQIGGVWYFFNPSGEMVTGWQEISGKWYYFNSSGAMQTGWLNVDGHKYYLGTDGVMVFRWQRIGGEWYYFNNSGELQIGYRLIDGEYYYFDSNGVMASNEWVENVPIGKRTYFDIDGHILVQLDADDNQVMLPGYDYNCAQNLTGVGDGLLDTLRREIRMKLQEDDARYLIDQMGDNQWETLLSIASLIFNESANPLAQAAAFGLEVGMILAQFTDEMFLSDINIALANGNRGVEIVIRKEQGNPLTAMRPIIFVNGWNGYTYHAEEWREGEYVYYNQEPPAFSRSISHRT